MQNENQTASSEKSEQMKYFTNVGRIAFILFMGLSIFFISGFVVIKVGISNRAKQRVPNLIGKLYLDVHNLLAETGYKVELERIHTTNYPFGYITAQSISPGSLAKEGAKLVLLVNQSEAIVKTPKLVGLQEELVDGKLQVYQRDRKYTLKKGSITYIMSDSPEGEVIDQFPAENTPVVPGYPVSLLVSDGQNEKKHRLRNQGKFIEVEETVEDSKKKKKKKKTALYIPDLQNQSIEIAKSAAYQLRMPATIKIQEVDEFEKNAVVLSQSHKQIKTEISVEPDEIVAELEFVVGRSKNAYEESWPNQFVWLDSSELGEINKLVTFARENRLEETGDLQKLNTEAEVTSYTGVSFLKLSGDPVPVFRIAFDKVAVWQGYNPVITEPETLAEGSETENEETPEAKSILSEGEISDSKPVVEPKKPARVIEIDTLEL